ncbi:UDP binding domain-containing protein [Pseudarthrobacter sp. So.54]
MPPPWTSPCSWRQCGAQVTVTDPAAINNASLRYPQLRFEQSTSLALKGADLVLLLTEWDDYATLSPVDTGALVRHRRILDARNVLDAPGWEAEGWTIRGLGRTAAASRQIAGPLGREAAAGHL